MTYQCKFCNESCKLKVHANNPIKANASCNNCHIDYYLNNNVVASQIYRIFNHKYKFVIMDAERNKTEIYLEPASSPKSLITVDGIFLDTEPHNLILLLQRILNLKSFL